MEYLYAASGIWISNWDLDRFGIEGNTGSNQHAHLQGRSAARLGIMRLVRDGWAWGWTALLHTYPPYRQYCSVQNAAPVNMRILYYTPSPDLSISNLPVNQTRNPDPRTIFHTTRAGTRNISNAKPSQCTPSEAQRDISLSTRRKTKASIRGPQPAWRVPSRGTYNPPKADRAILIFPLSCLKKEVFPALT